MSFHQQLKNKIKSRDELEAALDVARKEGRRIVFTNGCFDILHPGHVDYLCQARDLGDLMVLGLNTDESVRKLDKAPNRPVNNEFARATVLASLACVDHIVLFGEETPYELIRFVKPEVLVKGNDYTVEQIVGHDIVMANGGRVVTIPLLQGFSTTGLIKKITG